MPGKPHVAKERGRVEKILVAARTANPHRAGRREPMEKGRGPKLLVPISTDD